MKTARPAVVRSRSERFAYPTTRPIDAYLMLVALLVLAAAFVADMVL